MVKGFLIDVWNGEAKVVEFEDKLENIYKMLNVEIIDVTERKIENHVYDVVCDDEGLFKEKRIASAYDSKGEPVLVGSLLLVNHDDEGNFASLTDEQVIELRGKVKSCITLDGTMVQVVKVLTDVNYAV